MQMSRHAFSDLHVKMNRHINDPIKYYDSMIYAWSVSIQCRSGWKSSSLSTNENGLQVYLFILK